MTILSRYGVAHFAASSICKPPAKQQINGLPVSAPCTAPLPHAGANSSEIQAALTIVFGVIGAVALLIIVIAGFQFIVSQGDPQKTANARNAIIYASVGLVVSILAVTIVGFVIGHF